MAKTHKKLMHIPTIIMDQIKSYEEEKGIQNTSAAILELIRKGLESEKQGNHKVAS